MDDAFIAKWLPNWDHRMPLPWQRSINRLLRYTRIGVQTGPRSFQWGMASVEARMNLFHLASQCAAFRVPGDFVEIGCNAGESSVVIQHIANTLAPNKQVHFYDSFEGAPAVPPGGVDSQLAVYGKGDMSASLFVFHDTFRRVGLPPPTSVHKGWFEETIPAQLPDQIAFALLDGDLYSSTKHVLPHLYARMAPGAVCMFGVYYDEAVLSRPSIIPQYKSPGVKLATDEFFAGKPEHVAVLYAGEYTNGYFRKT